MKALGKIILNLTFILTIKVGYSQCCGNGICETGENATNCPYDCGTASFNCGNTIGSFFSSPTWPVSSSTAQANGWCYTLNPPYPSQVCFEYMVPNVGDSASVSFSINACGGTTVNQSNYPPGGGCNNAGYSSGTITGVSTYDGNCNQVSSAISTGGPGCYTPGEIITICLDINTSTACSQIIICPVIACGQTNCATSPTTIGCPPFNFTDSTYIALCDSSSGYAVVTPNCGSHFTYLWDDPLAQTDSVATGLTPGTYNVTITNTAFGCDTTITVVVPNTTNNADATIAPSGPFCENSNNINLNATDNGGIWSGNGITDTINGIFDPSIPGPGNHTIIYTISGICGDTDTTNIIVNPIITTQQSLSICQGDSVLLEGNYQNSNGVYIDTLSSSLNCDSIIQTALTVIPIVTSQQLISICQGDSVFLGGSFQTDNGIYNDTLTSSSNCDSILETTLNVTPIYSTQIYDSICQGDSILLGGSYQTIAGNYYDTLQTILSCDSIIETILSINPLPTITTNSDTTICNGLTVTLNANGAVSYNWDNGLGSGQTQTVSPSTTTTFTVSGTDSNGCSDTSSTTVFIEPLTLANAGSNQVFCDDIISFSLSANQPLNSGETGLWTTLSSAIINNPNLPNTIVNGLDTGTNTFVWTISSGSCPPSSDTVIIDIENCDPSVLIIPNVFTPNGDGMNDIFTIGTVKIASLNCEIYNRWGQKLFYWDGINGFWDGRTTAGVEVPDGTYFYMLNATGEDNEEYFKKGSFSLIR